MAANQHHKRISIVLASAVLVVLLVSTYLVISDLAGKQSQQHQQSISPVFTLIEEQLIHPLQIATTLADVGIYDEYFLSETPNQQELVEQLKSLEETFGLLFYLAHDKSRKQFNSDGSVFDLVEGKVIWYFALKEQTDSRVQAVLGKREDVHLYIDVRQYGEQGEFIGFVGVGKSLADFLESFEEFRDDYGHEFIFVNNNDEIVLSSISEFSPAETNIEDGIIGIKSTSDIPWYTRFLTSIEDSQEPSAIVKTKKGDSLVSKLDLQSLNWSLYIITPLDLRQQEVNQSFILFIVIGMGLSFLAYKVLFRLVDARFTRRSRLLNQDALTGLSNKEHAHVFFSHERKKERQIAIIIGDIDDFAHINNTLGKEAGDELLQSVAYALLKKVRQNDLVVRLTNDKFMIIMPNTTENEANEQATSLYRTFELLPITLGTSCVKITISFGCCASRDYNDSLDIMMERAYEAVQQAKQVAKQKV
ncbi:GGDEF domain-containing protein [Glaciecola siphonariae]|uniref:diguanylate cyclase n=1 Tax=Glaciecola siphonariae TaxID=521012 RepID=A0ABV9M068_9ALTE